MYPKYISCLFIQFVTYFEVYVPRVIRPHPLFTRTVLLTGAASVRRGGGGEGGGAAEKRGVEEGPDMEAWEIVVVRLLDNLYLFPVSLTSLLIIVLTHFPSSYLLPLPHLPHVIPPASIFLVHPSLLPQPFSLPPLPCILCK